MVSVGDKAPGKLSSLLPAFIPKGGTEFQVEVSDRGDASSFLSKFIPPPSPTPHPS